MKQALSKTFLRYFEFERLLWICKTTIRTSPHHYNKPKFIKLAKINQSCLHFNLQSCLFLHGIFGLSSNVRAQTPQRPVSNERNECFHWVIQYVCRPRKMKIYCIFVRKFPNSTNRKNGEKNRQNGVLVKYNIILIGRFLND